MVKPMAFVKVGSVLALLKRLGGRVMKGRGWSVSELGGDQWLSRGPRYFFAGQARRAEGGVTVEPLWVRAFSESGFTQIPVSGAVSVPVPGVIGVKVVWEVSWGPDEVLPTVLAEFVRVVSVSLEGAGAVVPSLRAAVDYTIVGTVPDEVVSVISSRSLAMAWVALATVDVNGVVTHLEGVGGLDRAVMDVLMPLTEFFFEGVPE
ncbi:MAG: hypothetical protein QE274_00350 [Verrucomicrobiaceae bacterium]|nr:hypothetical protein [Verrucomicrobiaceae bacterium]